MNVIFIWEQINPNFKHFKFSNNFRMSMLAHGNLEMESVFKFGMKSGRNVMNWWGIDWKLPAFKISKFSLTSNFRPFK
jgi:hypothetical protein